MVYFIRRITAGTKVGKERDDFAQGNRIGDNESYGKAMKDFDRYDPGESIGMGSRSSGSGQVSFLLFC